MTIEKRLDTIDHHLETITEPGGRLTESTTAFRADMAKIKETVREQSKISQQQAENVARLLRLAEQCLAAKS